jgi:enterochelin esterase-like enzyme
MHPKIRAMKKTLLLILVFAFSSSLGAQGARGGRFLVAPAYAVQADRTVTFTLRAPEATAVQVTGDFGNATAMIKGADGTWSATVGPLRPAIYNYAFIVNGVRTLDPGNPWTGAADRTPGISQFEVKADGPAPYDPQSVPHGALHINYYNSKTFGGALRMVYVYTPPGYEVSSARYPSLYLMHGAGDTESGWVTKGRANIILDNLIAQGQVRPMIVVMPYGCPGEPTTLSPLASAPAAGQACGSAPVFPVFPNDVVEDVVPYIDKTYRTASGADNRAIAGLSMGGNQSLYIGLNHLDTFHYIGAFSAVIFNPTEEKDHAPAFADVAATNKKLKVFYIYCGDADMLFASNKSFHELLDQKKVKHTFVETKEGHVWRNWRDYLADFAPRLFR